MRAFLQTATFFTVMTAVVLGGSRPAAAQSVAEPNTVTVTPFLGASFGTSSDLGSSLGIGAAIGYDLTRNLGFEAEFARVFDVAGDTEEVDWSLTNISGGVIYHFNVPRYTPYAAFGLGWERSNPTYDNPDPLALRVGPSTELAWHFGGGVKTEITDRLIARGDIRRFQVNDIAPDHWRVYGGLTFFVKR